MWVVYQLNFNEDYGKQINEIILYKNKLSIFELIFKSYK